MLVCCIFSSLDVLLVAFYAVFSSHCLGLVSTGSYYSNSVLPHCPALCCLFAGLLIVTVITVGK